MFCRYQFLNFKYTKINSLSGVQIMKKTLVCAFGKTGNKILSGLVSQRPELAEKVEFAFFVKEKCNGTYFLEQGCQSYQVIKLGLNENFSDKIESMLCNYSSFLFVAGLGGANGGSQLKIAVERASKKEKAFFCFLLMPFSFEGTHRRDFALQDLHCLKKLTSSFTVFQSDDCLDQLDMDSSYSDGLLKVYVPQLLEVIEKVLHENGVETQ
jgi:hypothetical protein